MLTRIITGCILALALTSTAFCAECTPDQMTISGLHAEREGEGFYAIGEVTNTCNEALGVQMEFTLYAENGTVLDTGMRWATNTTNIKPGGTRPFKLLMRYNKNMKRYSVTPVGLKKWPY